MQGRMQGNVRAAYNRTGAALSRGAAMLPTAPSDKLTATMFMILSIFGIVVTIITLNVNREVADHAKKYYEDAGDKGQAIAKLDEIFGRGLGAIGTEEKPIENKDDAYNVARDYFWVSTVSASFGFCICLFFLIQGVRAFLSK